MALPLRQAPTPRRDYPAYVLASRKHLKVLDESLDVYERHRHSCRHSLDSIKDGVSVLMGFFSHCGKVPGETMPEDFESWSASLRMRGVTKETQRKYQSTVRSFYKILLATPRLRNLVRTELGLDIEDVITSDNYIVHRNDRELGPDSPRTGLTEEQEITLFDSLESRITDAFHGNSGESLRSLQRDKVAIALHGALGTRETELLQLNIDSCEPNPKFPEFGRFGFFHVYGGKTSTWRCVAIDDPTLPPLLMWYVEQVRPKFYPEPGERALLLSERGSRLSYSGYYARFKQALLAAGLPLSLVPHCMRHTSVSTEAMDGMSPHANQQKHGHKFPATTQTYTHFPDGFIMNEFERVTTLRMKRTGT